MSQKNPEFDPLSALFREMSDQDEDVPEPLRVTTFFPEEESSDEEEDDEDTTQLSSVIQAKSELTMDENSEDENSDEEIVEPLALQHQPPPIDPVSVEHDETDRMERRIIRPPSHSKRHNISPKHKEDFARLLIQQALDSQEEHKEPAVKNPKSTSDAEQNDDMWLKLKKPRTALEIAMELAAEEETGAPKKVPSNKPLRPVRAEAEQEVKDETTLVAHISSLLQNVFPNLEDCSVVRAVYTDDREVFVALWKAHRSKFISEGRLEYAIATLGVIHALIHAPKDDLVAAHMKTPASDYLVWIRPSNGDVLAAFQDARRYFA